MVGYMDGLVGGWASVWMEGWMYVCEDGWVEGWMDGWLSRVIHDICMMEWRGACMDRPMQVMDECMGWMVGCMH